MKFLVATVLLAGSISVSAMPTNDLSARAITGATKGYNCDGVSFTAPYITSAIKHAAELKYNQDTLREMTTCDLSSTHARNLAFCQPKVYKNHPTATSGTLNFPNCPKGPWNEFPLMKDGKTLYQPPNAPGRDNPARVIFQYTDNKTAKFCGAITHAEIAGAGDFISCI